MGQISYIAPEMAALRELNSQLKAANIEILRTVTYGISCSIYFHDPENNVGEVYYKTGFVVKQGFSRSLDLEDQTDQEILDFSQSFEATEGPLQGAQVPLSADD